MSLQTTTDQAISIAATDPETQLPEPVQVSRQELKSILLNDPGLLFGALRELLERAVSTRPAPMAASNTTAISNFLSPAELQRLSPKAQQLTRGDLLALAGWGMPKKNPQDLGLTVDDVKTLRDCFGQRLASEITPQDTNVSCCCCSPCCCCAAAVIDPVTTVD